MSFDDDTRVTRAPGGGWDALVSDAWDGARGVPNGGHLLATALRALAADVGAPDPLTVSALYLRRARHGAAHVQTSVRKRGRRISFGDAVLQQDGADVVRVQASFGDLDRADVPPLAYDRGAPPELPPPDACTDPLTARDPGGGAAVGEQAATSVLGRLELRLPGLPGWARGRPGGDPSMQLWVRLRDDRDADALALVQVVDGLPPVVADLGAWSTTIELTVHLLGRPAPGWLRARVVTHHVGHGHHDEEVELWDSAGALVARSRQLALVVPFDD